MARYKTPRIAGIVFKAVTSLFIFGVCGLLIWRVFFSTVIPDTVEPLLSNPALSEAYAEQGDALTLRYQDLSTITRSSDRRGYFSVVSCVFIPEAEQVQIVFRYNNSTIRHLQKDYGLPELPKKSDKLFDITLAVTTDMTPDTKEDNLDASTLAVKRFYPSEPFVREETSLYTYYRYVFDGVTLDALTDGVYVDVYYVNDINYESKPYGSLLIYAWDEDWIAYPATRADWNAIRG